MMSLDTIERLSDNAARDAARDGKYPYTPEVHELAEDRFAAFCSNIPNLGTFKGRNSRHPKGWRPVGDALFVDSSGFGADDEPALSFHRFRAKVLELFAENPQYGYGIVQCGQFQIYIQVFERV